MIRQQRIPIVDTLLEGRASTPRRAWLETLVVTALLPGIGWLIDSSQPFFVSGFPWVVLAPLLLGLQNGFRYALVSSICLLAGALAHWNLVHTGADAFPVDYLLSVGLLGPLAGEYRNKWQRAFDATRRESQQRGQRLEQVARAYHLLERSHNELEQRIAGGGRSLDAALAHARAQLRRSQARSLAEAGDGILQLFSHYGQVQVATLHAVHTGRGPRGRGEHATADIEMVAALGQVADMDLDHPMVRDALDRREVTSVREERMAIRDSAPLACVPLVDSSDRLWGLLLVHEMPFMAMSDQNMKLLAVLGGRVGDWLTELAYGEAEATPILPGDAPAAVAEDEDAEDAEDEDAEDAEDEDAEDAEDEDAEDEDAEDEDAEDAEDAEAKAVEAKAVEPVEPGEPVEPVEPGNIKEAVPQV